MLVDRLIDVTVIDTLTVRVSRSCLVTGECVPFAAKAHVRPRRAAGSRLPEGHEARRPSTTCCAHPPVTRRIAIRPS